MNIDMRRVPRDQQIALYATALCITRLSDLKGQSDRAGMLAKQALERYQKLQNNFERMNGASREFAQPQLENEGDTLRQHKNRYKTLQLETEHHDRRLCLAVQELAPEYRMFEAPFYLNTRAQLQGAYQFVLSHGSGLQIDGEALLEKLDIKHNEMSRRANRSSGLGFH